MFLKPTFPDIDSEQQIAIEEMLMYEDEPSDRVHDVLADDLRRAPAGARVLGTAEVIGSIPIPDISAYHEARYRGSNIVVSAAGSLEHDRIDELVQQHLQPGEGRSSLPTGTERRMSRGSASTRRRPSSTTSASGRPGSRATTTTASPSA